MNIDLIYTFNDSPQEFYNIDFYCGNRFPDKKTFINIITEFIEDMSQLVKVSCCLYNCNKPPKWFINCNGKFYFKNGKIY